MKKLLSLMLAFLLVLNPFVLAQEVSENAQAGTTPDSPLWGVERAMERLSLLITFGKAAKAKKGLMHARERLAEVKAMIEAKKLSAAEEAQEAHSEIMEEMEENINEISEDPNEELESEVEIEKELTEQDEDLADLEDNVDVKIIGTLTPEQQEKLDALLVSLQSSSEKVRVKINAKRDKTRIKLKTKLGMSDAQADEAEEAAEEKANLENLREKLVNQQVKRIEKKITNLRNLAAQAKEKGKDVSSLEQRLDEAESLLNQVKEATDKSLKELKDLIHEINKLLNFRQVFMALKGDLVVEPENEEEEEEIECVVDEDCEEGEFCNANECEDLEEEESEEGEE